MFLLYNIPESAILLDQPESRSVVANMKNWGEETGLVYMLVVIIVMFVKANEIVNL